jgi:hypothetical protein
MNTKDFIQLLDNKNAVKNLDLKQLDSVLESFPFFQSARMLYLKNLSIKHNFQFNSYLKNTAAYVGDRTVLFEYITTIPEEDEEITTEVPNIKNNIVNDDNNVEKAIVAAENININKKDDNKIKEVPKETHSTLDFSENDRFSFNEWLQLSNVREIHRKIDKKINEKNKILVTKEKKRIIDDSKFDLINKFIDNNPKLRPAPKDEAISGNIALSGAKENDGWMTETLAQVYIEQKKYSKAIKAYKILGLKYPEKSGFFADRIREIKKLSEH